MYGDKGEETKGVQGFRAKAFVAVGAHEATDMCEASCLQTVMLHLKPIANYNSKRKSYYR